tara:strand:+ start:3398 stop:3586 length:189 start_codon:yes stop_codon:yes gene_type:complete
MEQPIIKEWYDKAERVIESCDNDRQLDIALNYTELYIERTNDTSGYHILLRKYDKKKNELMV